MELYITAIGLLAAALTTCSLFPQILKIWETKSTRDISIRMYGLFCVGAFAWFVYGVLMWDMPIIVANLLGLMQGLAIVVLKRKYK